MENLINKKGYWETEDYTGHAFDPKLCDTFISFLKMNNIKSLLDIGCGFAQYSKLAKFSINDLECNAYDGNPNTEKLTDGFAKTLDFSKEINLEKEYECVLCLEVGEHIPKEYEQVFISNICRHSSKLVVLSWAVPGQPGWGHVNCQTNEYIIQEMEKRKFKYIPFFSDAMRNSVESCWWFKNTVMVFSR